jgi:hypothetical protein
MPALVLIVSLLTSAEMPEPPTIVVVVGAPGASKYEQEFCQWAGRWQHGAEQAGAPCFLMGASVTTGQPDRQQLETLLADLPKKSLAPLWLVLIGHGTFDGRSAKFNMRGPDVTAAELAEWLKPYERTVAVINCASSSGPFINRLSGPNRVVVTATKSGYELNYARFGDYMSAAICDPAADLDKDGQTSLLEAFLSASARVAEFYEQEARLATETAILDDNGDGLGTPAAWFRGIRVTQRARDGASADGSRAHQLHLIPSQRERNMPAEVRARRDELELAIAKLRDSKAEGVQEDEYYRKLEPLLVELARLYAAWEDSANASETTSSPP